MKHPYYNSSNAWRWVLVLYRLSNLQTDLPLRITPKSALATARMRLFYGRMYVLDSSDTQFAPYQAASAAAKITTERDYMLVVRRPEYVPPVDNSTFKLAFDFINHFMKSNDVKADVVLPSPLQPQQTAVLAEYISNLPIRPAMVTNNQIVLTK